MSTYALDATLWDEPTTGIGLYTHMLARALEARGARLERLGAQVSGEDPRGAQGRTAYVLTRLPGALRRSEAVLFHALGNFNLPAVRVPGKAYVLTVHDLIPLDMPDTVSRAYGLQFRLWLGRSLALADRVVCVSERTRRDLLRRHPEVEARAVVVHNGVDHVESEPLGAVDEALVRALHLPDGYLLYAGSLDARKNVALVLDALERLHARGESPTLVMVGQRWFGSGPAERRVQRLRERGLDIRTLGYQPAPVLFELMRRAGVFVFPSRYEGFGLPPLEAMRLGAPTVVSDAGSLPEVCGDAAPAVRPDDADGLAALLSRLLRSPEERRAWSEKGRLQAARFTWARTAERTLTVYEDAVRHRAR